MEHQKIGINKRKPDISPEPTATPAPTVSATPSPTPAAPAKGTVVEVGKVNYKIGDGNTVAFAGPTDKKAKKAKIPDKVVIDGKQYRVTSIAKNAFKGSKIKSVTIPKSVTIIESNAFANCKNLTSVIIPAGVKTIQSKAFSGCKALGTVIFKGNTNVKPKAFMGIKKGASFKVPKKLVKIYEKSLPKCGAKKYKLK